MTAATQLNPHPRNAAQARPTCWGVDPELFYGPGDSPGTRRVLPWEQQALAVCAHCPVTAGCLAAALEFPPEEQYGGVGGMTAGRRRALLRAAHRQPSRSSITATRADRRRLVAAAIRLHQAGHRAQSIATRLEVGERRVQRWLTAHRAALTGQAQTLPEGVA